MSEKNFIEFKKERKAGEIVTDTFAFVRKEFNPMINLFIKVVGPFLLLAIGAQIYQLLNPASSWAVLINSLVGMAVSALSYCVILFYIKSYMDNKGEVNNDEIKINTKGRFLGAVGLLILMIIALVLGFVLLVIPGVYLIVPLSITFAAYIFRAENVTEAFNYSSRLIKGNWWNTLGVLLLVFIVVVTISLVFTLPTVIYTWIKLGVFSGTVGVENGLGSDPVFILITVVNKLLEQLVTIVFVVASAFIYFDLNEQVSKSGALEQIAELGSEVDEE